MVRGGNIRPTTSKPPIKEKPADTPPKPTRPGGLSGTKGPKK